MWTRFWSAQNFAFLPDCCAHSRPRKLDGGYLLGSIWRGLSGCFFLNWSGSGRYGTSLQGPERHFMGFPGLLVQGAGLHLCFSDAGLMVGLLKTTAKSHLWDLVIPTLKKSWKLKNVLQSLLVCRHFMLGARFRDTIAGTTMLHGWSGLNCYLAFSNIKG